MAKKGSSVNVKDLEVLANLSQTKEWAVLSRLLDNRRESDKNKIITIPEHEPMKLATKKSFYRGRISAVNLIMQEVNEAGKNLDIKMEKQEHTK